MGIDLEAAIWKSRASEQASDSQALKRQGDKAAGQAHGLSWLQTW